MTSISSHNRHCDKAQDVPMQASDRRSASRCDSEALLKAKRSPSRYKNELAKIDLFNQNS